MPSVSVHTITGTVVKATTPQTIKIATKVTKEHPLYRKRYTLTKTYIAHDPNGTAKLGDVVTIAPCRPVSKSKRWQVL